MKRLAAFIVSLILASALVQHTSAYDGDSIIEKYEDYLKSGDGYVSVTEFLTGESDEKNEDRYHMKEFFDSLPEEVKDKLPEGLENADPLNVSSALEEALSLGSVAGSLVGVFKRVFSRTALTVLALVSLALISFLIKTFAPSFAERGACAVIFAAMCIGSVTGGVAGSETVGEYLKTVCILSQAASPACAALLVSVGRFTSAGVTVTFLSLYQSAVETVLSGIVLPMIFASYAMAFAEAVFPDKMRLNISGAICRLSVGITVILATVSSFIFGAQSFLSGAAEGIGVKSVKFAASGLIPFVGGAIGDTASAIFAGAASVKSVFGVALIVVLAVIIISPLVSLALGRAGIGVTASLCSALGLEREERLLKKLSAAVGAQIALVACSGGAFLVMAVTFMSLGAIV